MKWGWIALVGVLVAGGTALLMRPSAPSPEAPLETLRQEVASNPAQALSHIREDESVQPNAAWSDERAFLKMQAYVNQGDIAGARKEATAFLERNPYSPWAAKITALTGVHAHTSKDFPTPGR